MSAALSLTMGSARTRSSVTTYMSDTLARASMGTTTSGGQTIGFDAGSCVIATIDSSTWLTNIGAGGNASYRVNVGAQSTFTLDFDINPGTGTNFGEIRVGIRSDGTFQNYVALVFDGFGHLKLASIVAAVYTTIGSQSAASIDNSGATTYHIQLKVDASNNYTTKVNGVTDANLAGNSASFASGPYFHAAMNTGALIAGTGIKNIVLTS